MSSSTGQHIGRVWVFGPFRLDCATQELTRDGAAIPIEPQSHRLLEYLLLNRDRVVSRHELVESIWQGRAVSDWAISGAIKSVRAALGIADQGERYVRTIRSRGFRFVGEVTEHRAPVVEHSGETSRPCVLVREIRLLSSSVVDDYLADGITEDLITDIARLTSARVLSRNASRALAASQDLSQHGVTHVVDGSLRRHGQILRFNVAVLDAQQEHAMWTERFDFSPSSLLAAQDQISLRLAGVVDPVLQETPGRHIGTARPDAYDAYLKGRYAYYRYDPGGFAAALEHFRHAIDLDPGFADAFAHQAYCRTALFVFGWPGADETLDPVEAIARRAIALDDSSALAHARLGWVLGYRGQPKATIAAFDAAVMRDRDIAEVYYAYGETMNRLAQPERALEILAQAFAKDSFHPPAWEFAKGHSRVLLGDFDQAIAHFEAVLDRVERFIPARVQLARALVEAGRPDDAAGIVSTIRRFAPKCDLAAAERMFPYPVEAAAHRFRSGLTTAGL